MCWVCNPLVKSGMATEYWAGVLGVDVAHFEALSQDKNTTALGSDGVGDGKAPVITPDVLVTTDNIGGDTGTATNLEIDGASIISTIDTIGDEDFFRVELEAGETYEFGQYAEVGGPSGTPLADAYIELYDANGNLLTTADGGGPDTPSGLDALLSFTALTSGTYYINARAYDNAPEDGENGDLVGDYEVFARVAPEGAYTPYYDVDSPLYALDWGSQVNRVNQSARNPDGDEGPRDTGNAQGTPVYGPNMDSILAENGMTSADIAGKNVITIYFAKPGDVISSEDPTNPGLPPATVTAEQVQQFERDAVFTALGEFEKVADVIYLEVDNRDDADFTYTSYKGTPGPGASLLGSMSPPDESDEGLAQFNSGDYRWNATDLAQGGFSYVTLIHEFGHGHGMAHPHDNGGRSGIMNGVEEVSTFNYTTGDFALNQGVHTMMSYQDGWQESPYGNAPTDVGYGYLGGLMAFDIAVIQDKYGVNEDTATGDDVYRMSTKNAAGTFYSSIWDAAGTDLITYDGLRNANIDLRAASLEYEVGGGGRVSYAYGIFGGYTIANGVVIENASSGSGDDKLTGNEVANLLNGNAGEDVLRGLGGGDGLRGSLGNDLLLGGAGNDMLIGATGNDTLLGQNGNDVLAGDDGIDTLRGGAGVDRVSGGTGADSLFGNTGNDLLIGGAGRDVLNGGTGADLFVFGNGDASATRGQADVIEDFLRGQGDKISLSQIDANASTEADDKFSFIGDGDFSGTAGELRFETVDGSAFLQGDTNGDSVADFYIRVENVTEIRANELII
jgi:Ca2+-binding RTX toxin-like protein